MEEMLGLDGETEDSEAVSNASNMSNHGVEVWIIDACRPWNLENVFGGQAATTSAETGVSERLGTIQGKILPSYRPGRGGVVVWDDDDLDRQLQDEKESYFALHSMPEIDEDDVDFDHDDEETEPLNQENSLLEPSSGVGEKRKRDDHDLSDSTDDEDDRSSRRRRGDSSDSIPIPSSPGGNPLSAQFDGTSTPPTLPSSPPKLKSLSAKELRRQFLKLRRNHEATLLRYYRAGQSNAEPVSSMVYSLASELGREDNDLLWLAIVGITSVIASPAGIGAKANQVREVLQDEVRRLNPVPDAELRRSQSAEGSIPTTARSPTDTSIRLSPEPRFLLTRHWSLYDAMLHSPFLATRLHVWSDSGRKRLHKLLAKMGISLQEAGKGYLHMDSEIKRTLRKRILKFAEQYNLDGLIPGETGDYGMRDWGFVRSWGWRGTLSAEDAAVTVGAILEIGADLSNSHDFHTKNEKVDDSNYNMRMRNLPTPPHSSDDGHAREDPSTPAPDYITRRFFQAYDALASGSGLPILQQNIPTAQKLYKAILRVGSAIISKKQIRHLRSFRMAVVKEGPDVALFTHPGALTRLAAWIGEAMAVIEIEKGRRTDKAGSDAWVLAAFDEHRGLYVVVGLGGSGGWNGSGPKMRSKAEMKQRQERKTQREASKAAKKAEKIRQREDRRRLRRERNAANGLFESDEEASDSEADTDSESSSGSNSSMSDSESGSGDRGKRRKRSTHNRFGLAFQETVQETGARVRLDSFEHSVVEVNKEDLSGFLEALSMKIVVG